MKILKALRLILQYIIQAMDLWERYGGKWPFQCLHRIYTQKLLSFTWRKRGSLPGDWLGIFPTGTVFTPNLPEAVWARGNYG